MGAAQNLLQGKAYHIGADVPPTGQRGLHDDNELSKDAHIK